MPIKPGVSYKKAAVELCMVAGCMKKALYVNATSKRHEGVRGYCADHKAHAVSIAPGTEENMSKWFSNRRWD